MIKNNHFLKLKKDLLYILDNVKLLGISVADQACHFHNLSFGRVISLTYVKFSLAEVIPCQEKGEPSLYTPDQVQYFYTVEPSLYTPDQVQYIYTGEPSLYTPDQVQYIYTRQPNFIYIYF